MTLEIKCFILFFCTLIIAFCLSPLLIKFISYFQSSGQPIYDLAPKTHQAKRGTPTMGGIIILVPLLITYIYSIKWQGPTAFLLIIVLISYSLLGLYDDFSKITNKNNRGIGVKKKLLWQAILAGAMIGLIKILNIPVDFNNFQLGKYIIFLPTWVYYFLAIFILTAYSNAVNLTDGLDGLAIGPIIISLIFLCIVAWIKKSPESEGVLFISLLLIASSLVFLWWNCFPASLFMGDIGSLSLGAFVGASSLILKVELLLAFSSVLFILEAVSDIIQVGYFKFSQGKRIFLMAPLHHHFEQKGWPENKIVIRSWIISIIATALSLFFLYLQMH